VNHHSGLDFTAVDASSAAPPAAEGERVSLAIGGLVLSSGTHGPQNKTVSVGNTAQRLRGCQAAAGTEGDSRRVTWRLWSDCRLDGSDLKSPLRNTQVEAH